MAATNGVEASASRKASINLTAAGNKEMELSGATKNHARLKNLDFENSGHTGFQQELTNEQLEAIETVPGKEDKSNKIQSINELIDDEQYLSAGGTLTLVNTAEDNAKAHADGLYNDLNPRVTMNEESIEGVFAAIQSNESRINTVEEQVVKNTGVIDSNVGRIIALEDKATEIENEIDACGDFELVASDELTEKVGVIELTLPNQYKELYLRFTIPPSEEAAGGSASTDKARFALHTLNDSATYINKVIYNQGNQFIQDYTAEWYAAFRIQIFGNSNNAYCRTELWYETTFYATGGYARGMNSGTYSGYVAPSVPMVRDYIKRLKISFMVSAGVVDTSVRYLPIGTKYELWGVRK